MLYKTVKGSLVVNKVINTDTGEVYVIANYANQSLYGYYLLRRYNDNTWWIVKTLRKQNI